MPGTSSRSWRSRTALTTPFLSGSPTSKSPPEKTLPHRSPPQPPSRLPEFSAASAAQQFWPTCSGEPEPSSPLFHTGNLPSVSYQPITQTSDKKEKISAPAVMPVMGLSIPRLTPPAVRRTLPRIIGTRKIPMMRRIRMITRRPALLRCIRRNSNRTPRRNRKTDNRHNTHDRRELSKLHTDLFRLKKYQGIRRIPSLTLLPASAAYLQPSTPHRPQDPQHQSSGTDPDNCRSLQEVLLPQTKTQTRNRRQPHRTGRSTKTKTKAHHRST